MATTVGLTEGEDRELARLLKKAGWPLSKEVFGALVGKTVTVPIELCVMNEDDKVLTFYRKDEEYAGHHMPGTVLRDNESVGAALHRLIESEVVGGEISTLQNVGWTEIPKGFEPWQNPTRHEISLLWLARLHGEYRGKSGVFSSLNNLPGDTLPHHQVLAEKFRRFLVTGKPILGD